MCLRRKRAGLFKEQWRIVKPEHLKKLAGMSNVEELRAAIEALCLPFGSIKDVRLIPEAHGVEYLCFVELDSPNKNAFMIEQLGGINYGYSVAFRIPFKPGKA
jgi:hypothetical protein